MDSYALAIGEQDNSNLLSKNLKADDPWKSKTGGLVDMKKIMEKRGNEIVKNMHSNFARETNQRDEDAEMQKFIEEQLRMKKESERLKTDEDGVLLANNVTAETSSVSNPASNAIKYRRPEDALFDLPKYLIESNSKMRSEESLSEQMLSGIPEVDLGVDERIRNIEETEKAKQALIKNRHSVYQSNLNSQYAPHNLSINFVQHKRFDDTLINPDRIAKFRHQKAQTVQKLDEPVVGDAPKHELLITKHVNKRHHTGPVKSNQQDVVVGQSDQAIKSVNASSKPNEQNRNQAHKRPTTEKATDDYCLERFKKNMRHGKGSKIRIA